MQLVWGRFPLQAQVWCIQRYSGTRSSLHWVRRAEPCSQKDRPGERGGPYESYISAFHRRVSCSRLRVHRDMLGRECSPRNDFCKSEILDCRDDVGVSRWPHLYETDIVNARLALFVASLMVIAAIVIVNVTIFLFHTSSTSHGFTLAEIAGIFSLVFSGVVIVMAIIAFILALYSQKMRTAVKDYYQRVTKKERNALNTYNHV